MTVAVSPNRFKNDYSYSGAGDNKKVAADPEIYLRGENQPAFFTRSRGGDMALVAILVWL